MNFADDLYHRSLWGCWGPCEYITNFLIVCFLTFFALLHGKTYQIGSWLFLTYADFFEGAAFDSFEVLEEIVGLFAGTLCDIEFQGLGPILSDEGFGSWIVDFKQVGSLNNKLNYRFKGLFLLEHLFEEEDLVFFRNLGVFVPFFTFKNWHFHFLILTQVVNYLYQLRVW